VFVSFEPIIEPLETLRLMDEVAPFVEHIRIGKVNHHEIEKRVAAKFNGWKSVGSMIARKLDDLDVPYAIKHDLAPYMPEGFTLDTRDETMKPDHVDAGLL
jgi:hypothetical protein